MVSWDGETHPAEILEISGRQMVLGRLRLLLLLQLCRGSGGSGGSW